MAGWSQIINTPLGQAARAVYESGPARHYHNWAHIERLYWHAEHSFGFDYDPELDRAILAHDVIYDAGADKEIRSADWLRAHATGPTAVAEKHILKTIAHTPSDDNRMVHLDLADFLYPERIGPNLQLIAAESCALYGIDMDTFFAANAGFMTVLRDQIKAGITPDISREDAKVFNDICTGINTSIAMAQRAKR